jgi:hypothetical protein
MMPLPVATTPRVLYLALGPLNSRTHGLSQARRDGLSPGDATLPTSSACDRSLSSTRAHGRSSLRPVVDNSGAVLDGPLGKGSFYFRAWKLELPSGSSQSASYSVACRGKSGAPDTYPDPRAASRFALALARSLNRYVQGPPIMLATALNSRPYPFNTLCELWHTLSLHRCSHPAQAKTFAAWANQNS